MTFQAAILQAREARWQRRLELALRYNAPVLSLKLNIPGPDKNPPGSRKAWELMAARTLQALQNASLHIVRAETASGPDGLALHIVVSASAVRVKHMCCALEEVDALGRLADLDVMDHQGKILSRSDLNLSPRSCLLCGAEAALCIRSGKHSRQEVLDRVKQYLAAYKQF